LNEEISLKLESASFEQLSHFVRTLEKIQKMRIFEEVVLRSFLFHGRWISQSIKMEEIYKIFIVNYNNIRAIIYLKQSS
jgi:hypothetical protein